MPITTVIPLSHFDRKLQYEIALYGPSDVRLREHAIFSWIDENLLGPWYYKVMITDTDTYLVQKGWEKRAELEMVHFTFSKRSDAVRFKLAWG